MKLLNVPDQNRPFREHKLRRPKRAIHFDPAFQRGHINNGIIDVALTYHDVAEEDGVVPRLSEQAIKLDFIEKAKK
jgi:hypothetical protein